MIVPVKVDIPLIQGQAIDIDIYLSEVEYDDSGNITAETAFPLTEYEVEAAMVDSKGKVTGITATKDEIETNKFNLYLSSDTSADFKIEDYIWNTKIYKTGHPENKQVTHYGIIPVAKGAIL